MLILKLILKNLIYIKFLKTINKEIDYRGINRIKKSIKDGFENVSNKTSYR